jgi:hypothetical protein
MSIDGLDIGQDTHIRGNLIVDGSYPVSDPFGVGDDGTFLTTRGTEPEWHHLRLEDLPPGTLNHLLPNGLPNQIYTMNLTGDDHGFTSDLIVPSTLNVQGSSVFESTAQFQQSVTMDNDLIVDNNLIVTNNDLNVLVGTSNLQTVDIQNGELKFGGNAGLNNQIPVSDNSGIVSWQTPSFTPSNIQAGPNYSVLSSFASSTLWAIPSQIKKIIYGTTFSTQNISVAIPSPAAFSLSPFTSIASSNTSPVSNITQLSPNEFQINTTALYQFEFNIFIDQASSTGVGSTLVLLSVDIGGIEQQQSCVVCAGHFATGKLYAAVVASQIVQIICRRLVGTGSLFTFDSSQSIPNFASTLVISSMN